MDWPTGETSFSRFANEMAASAGSQEKMNFQIGMQVILEWVLEKEEN